jgi:hypothetical protein
MLFYSARLHVVCIVDDPMAQTECEYVCDYPFILFRADSFEDAFKRALILGSEQETTYRNSDGNDVRWALNSVEEIYELGEDLDGLEIGSLMDIYRTEELLGFAKEFDPASKKPIFSSSVNTKTGAE